jgi:hypothetical protein
MGWIGCREQETGGGPPPHALRHWETDLRDMFHYTDKAGWNAIRSQVIWLFKISQPKVPDRAPEREVQMLGAIDTRLPTKAGIEAVEVAVRAIRQLWPHAVWENGESGERYDFFWQIPFGELTELFV